MHTSLINVKLKKGEDIVLSAQTKAKWLFPYKAIGSKSMKNKDTIDALDMICKFNKGELRLLKIIKDEINPNTNRLSIKRSGYGASDMQTISSAIRSCINKKILKRVSRELYIVNPYFITPDRDYQAPILDDWNFI